METEMWKPIPNFIGLYEVSNLGRIKSLNYKHRGFEKVLKLSAKDGKYIKVTLYNREGNPKTFRVHRIVAMAFLPEPTPEQIQVNHIDGDKQNNIVENLEWVSPQQNVNNPNTKHRMSIRYHRDGEFERRSAAQRKRFQRERELHIAKFADKRLFGRIEL